MTPTATASAPVKPVCPCRACAVPLDAIYQQGLLPGSVGHYLVTCWQAGCWMYGYTLALPNYPTVDLSIYRQSA